MNEVIEALRGAVAAAPESAALRIHLASVLSGAGLHREAMEHASIALQLEPQNPAALAALTAASAAMGQAPAPAPAPTPAPEPDDSSIDWDELSKEIGVTVPPPFVDEEYVDTSHGPAYAEVVESSDLDVDELGEVVYETTTLADVGGLDDVKARLQVAFLEPMRNPDIARAFGKSLRGGLLLYGPPGTGKTFIARAVAGELGARFLTVTMADILGSFIGESEGNVHKLFLRARKLAPCVLFLDELDAIGGRRSGNTSHWMRSVVNQLLQEMDGVGANNEGVFVLAATNHPWDIDSALLRPGRLDRSVLVLPPDAPARHAILKHHLKDRPVAGIDLGAIVNRTDGFSGADLEHLTATAAEYAMMASLKDGVIRTISQDDLTRALREVKPSIMPWLQSAVNVVSFANADGRYDELAAYLKSKKLM